MKHKIIFLDIDGVLNYAPYGEPVYEDRFAEPNLALDSECINNLRTIVESFDNSCIVWSTDWRYYEHDKWGQWRNPVKYIETLSWLKDKIIGKTPMKMSSEHFHDIKWWLDENKDVVDNYVILEDSYFPKKWFGIEKHLIEVNSEFGLTEENAKVAIDILKTAPVDLDCKEI